MSAPAAGDDVSPPSAAVAGADVLPPSAASLVLSESAAGLAPRGDVASLVALVPARRPTMGEATTELGAEAERERPKRRS